MKSSIYHKVKILREVKKHRLQETLESNKPAQQHHQEQQVPEHSKDDDQQQLMHGIQEQDNAPKYSQDLTTNVLTPNFTPLDKLRHVIQDKALVVIEYIFSIQKPAALRLQPRSWYGSTDPC